MERIAVKYEYWPTYEDVLYFLKNFCGYERPEKLFVKSGVWTKKLPTYADNYRYDNVDTYSGIGIFENPLDEYPVIVVDSKKQVVDILKKEFMTQIDDLRGTESICLYLEFHRAFDKNLSMAALLDDIKKAMEKCE